MNLFCDAGISKESYDKFRTVGGITSSAYSAKDYCQNGIAKAMINDKQIKEEGYSHMAAYAVSNLSLSDMDKSFANLTVFLKTNQEKIAQAHYMETYLAYVNSRNLWKD